MTDAFANASHLKAKNILLDPSGTGTPYSFTLHPFTAADPTPRDNARISFVPKSNSIALVNFLPTGGDTIMDPDTKAAVSTLDVVMNGQSIEFIYWLSRTQWVVFREPSVAIPEFWQATPIIDIDLKTIQWTHVGPFATPIILSHAAGVLTYNLTNPKFLDAQLNVETAANIGSNNSDVDWFIENVFVGAGLELLPRIVGSKQSTRVSSFPSSQPASGGILFANGDTIKFDCTSTGSGGSTVDLTSAVFSVVAEI